jgi:DNA-binding response OmpR family regulator
MPNSQANDIKILIVEDDRTISELYTTKLRLEGHVVVQAYNGLEALKKIEKDSFDLILLDLRMPVMDGERFLEKLRKTNQSVQVIILTNLSREEAPKTLWHHGISGYFVKAHNTPSDLVKVIDEVITES